MLAPSQDQKRFLKLQINAKTVAHFFHYMDGDIKIIVRNF